ncbi:MAG: SUMF1/EgtB/PvdO family nonheme iron enzyme [Phycisphaeraceae bacterium]|nr:SUMF1/EgtB/PvdO family nonheme iron enzyme [Phycisphaeraceae bacterium]
MRRLLMVVLTIMTGALAVEPPQVPPPVTTMEVAAEPLSPLDILYVDDDGINDPGPNDLTVSDVDEDGSQAHPFDSIQEAIDAAREHVTVLVSDGRYTECLDFGGKSLDVSGFEPSDQAMSQYPIIDAMDQGVVVTFDQGEGAESRLSGFVLTRGLGDRAGAIACIDSSPTIRNCLVVGNRCADGQGTIEPGQGAIYCENSNSLFENCTIADNYGGKNGSGISVKDCHIVLSHSIVWGNAPEQIQVVSGNEPVVLSSCLDEDPLFALPGYWTDAKASSLVATDPYDPSAIWLEGDYHVLSLHGRYDRFAEAWAYDELTSDCIDLGDASLSVGYETAPHGDRVNAGAYGGSWMASRTGKLILVAIADPNFEGEMSKYEITNAQYRQYLNHALAESSISVYENRVYSSGDASHSRPYLDTFAASSGSQISFSEGAFEVTAQDGYNMSHHPVVEVSWYGATAFAKAHGYRLPTSQEWQAVADYDGSYAYGCGTTIDANTANFDHANPSGLPRAPYTSPVGYYPASGYGLCDLAGNVWEWTSSISGRFRLLHGGSWRDSGFFCTVDSRSGFNPAYTLSSTGFRLCR